MDVCFYYTSVRMTLDELMDIFIDVPPSDMTAEELLEFLDLLVPMSNVPKTGNNSWIWEICALISGAGLV